jgi:hypothetical protein
MKLLNGTKLTNNIIDLQEITWKDCKAQRFHYLCTKEVREFNPEDIQIFKQAIIETYYFFESKYGLNDFYKEGFIDFLVNLDLKDLNVATALQLKDYFVLKMAKVLHRNDIVFQLCDFPDSQDGLIRILGTAIANVPIYDLCPDRYNPLTFDFERGVRVIKQNEGDALGFCVSSIDTFSFEEYHMFLSVNKMSALASGKKIWATVWNATNSKKGIGCVSNKEPIDKLRFLFNKMRHEN